MDVNVFSGIKKTHLMASNENEIVCDSSDIGSPLLCRTPAKQIGMKIEHLAYQNNSGCFTLLPSHITPPSGLTQFLARNPFESDLTNRLHLSMISPTVFTKVADPSQESSVFSWNIEELAVIQPAEIEEFPIQQSHCTDPETERKAQAAIDTFFKENQIIPSPWDKIDENKSSKEEMQTPLRGFNETKESQDSTKDSWSQTTLSFPLNLPLHVEEILKPYFTFTQEQNMDSDEVNYSGNTSLRRKLFAHDDCHGDELEYSLSTTPMQSRSFVSCSPLQSGMFIHGTPLRGCPEKSQREYGTPSIFSDMSPLNMSPSSGFDDQMSCQSIGFQAQSAARLNFTADMSMQTSVKEIVRNKKNRNNCADKFLSEAKNAIDADKISLQNEKNETVEMTMDYEHSRQCTHTEKENQPSNCDCDSFPSTKFGNDLCRMLSSEACSHQENSTFSVTTNQHSAFHSGQDTGYQTYSINNTTNRAENYATSVDEEFHWNERLISSDDLRLLNCKDNIKNICSSTPSKFTKNRVAEKD